MFYFKINLAQYLAKHFFKGCPYYPGNYKLKLILREKIFFLESKSLLCVNLFKFSRKVLLNILQFKEAVTQGFSRIFLNSHESTYVGVPFSKKLQGSSNKFWTSVFYLTLGKLTYLFKHFTYFAEQLWIAASELIATHFFIKNRVHLTIKRRSTSVMWWS